MLTLLFVGFVAGGLISLLADKCRTLIDETSNCGRIFRLKTFVVSLVSSGVMLFLYLSNSQEININFLAVIVFAFALLLLSVIDYDTMTLPDLLTIPLMWAGILLATTHYSAVSLTSSIYGAVCGYMVLWGMFWLFKVTTGKEAMGYGDFKLLAAIGAWQGYQLLPVIILIASILGIITGRLFHAFNKTENGAFPFGIGLSLSAIVCMYCGSPLLDWYMTLISFNL